MLSILCINNHNWIIEIRLSISYRLFVFIWRQTHQHFVFCYWAARKCKFGENRDSSEKKGIFFQLKYPRNIFFKISFHFPSRLKIWSNPPYELKMRQQRREKVFNGRNKNKIWFHVSFSPFSNVNIVNGIKIPIDHAKFKYKRITAVAVRYCKIKKIVFSFSLH